MFHGKYLTILRNFEGHKLLGEVRASEVVGASKHIKRKKNRSPGALWPFNSLTKQSSVEIKRLIPSPHLMVLVITERFLLTRGTFRIILVNESHWLPPVLVLFVRWWPTPIGVGRV
jgi:hypothetical protein